MADSGLIIKRLADDVVSLKEQMTRIEITLNEIDKDIHREINPEYLINAQFH